MALFAHITAGVLVLAMFAGNPSAAFTFEQKAAGSRAHPSVLARHGGPYANVDLQDYMSEIGQRLAAVSQQPDEDWTFTVLNDPSIRAFAQPGGYIYVSRGLVAFASSEAELAAAMAHQMAHLMRNSLEPGADRSIEGVTELSAGASIDGLILAERDARSNISTTIADTGSPRPLSVDQEVAAALDGILILSKANYPSSAAADLARKLIEQDRAAEQHSGMLEVNMLGLTAFARRKAAEAIVTASASATVFEAHDRRDAYLLRLQGLTWGSTPEQGFVRGQHYLHPGLRITFSAPEGFMLSHNPAEVVATGPDGAHMILDTTTDPVPRLESYIRGIWAPRLTRGVAAGYLFDLRKMTIGGFEAASAFQPFEDETGSKVAQLVVIRTEDRVFRFRSIANAEDIASSLAMEAALDSFRQISSSEAAGHEPLWLHIHEVRPGDSLNLFAAAMPFRDGAEAQFRRINGIGENGVPLVGSLVKMVMQ